MEVTTLGFYILSLLWKCGQRPVSDWSLSPWAGGHRWEEVTTVQGTVCSLSPLVHRTTTSRRVESLLCPLYYLPNLNATAPSVTSHLLQVLSKQYRLLPCLSTKQA